MLNRHARGHDGSTRAGLHFYDAVRVECALGCASETLAKEPLVATGLWLDLALHDFLFLVSGQGPVVGTYAGLNAVSAFAACVRFSAAIFPKTQNRLYGCVGRFDAWRRIV